ncbi:MAG: glycosyltransferase, partial [Dysgonamonadaceae bacterium]|nr:glycosyltransferase [Dysgonamonadaceae bacterium]
MDETLKYVKNGDNHLHLLTNESKISVIIPFHYVAESLFCRAVEAVLNQTFTDFELILVNDCCTNDCHRFAEKYAAKDSRIKLIINSEKLGCPKSREMGLSQASGEYVIMSDADDYMEPHLLAELYSAIIKSGADIAYCDYFRHSEDEMESVRQGNMTGKIPFIKSIFAKEVWGVIWNKLVKKSVFEKIVFPTYFHYEDEVQTIQLMHFAERIEYVPLPLYHYYDHTKSEQFNNADSFVSFYHNYQVIIDFLKSHYKDIKMFNPELRRHINAYKYLCCFRCDDFHFTRELLTGLYPQSNR